MARAGKIPPDLAGIILARPQAYARLLRLSRGLPAALLELLAGQVSRHKKRTRA
jgi:hypothetical protein